MSDITLYTAATPNGFKISIVLEELGLAYHAQPVDLMANEQKDECVR
jgi:glutathione S-transferase